MSTSTSKWPAFVRMAPSFMVSKCSAVMMPLQPVTVMKRSPIFAASRMGMTSNPSITASSARTGSVSVTITFAPSPLARILTPLPHQP